jgi:selenide,water dikinase
MGGRPLLALSIAAFPEELPVDVLASIFASADAQVRAAGGVLAGGHTIRDAEPKYGLAVVGTASPNGIWPKSGARPGDLLYLTKPLGTGLLMQGHRDGLVADDELEPAVELMRTLNRKAADVLRPFEPNAVTDITGFGLLGHAWEVAQRSGVELHLDSSGLPALDRAVELAEAGVKTGGERRNRDFAGRHVAVDGAPDALVRLAYDPQTAGGLLVAIPRERGVSLEAAFAAEDLFLRRIGAVDRGLGVTFG